MHVQSQSIFLKRNKICILKIRKIEILTEDEIIIKCERISILTFFEWVVFNVNYFV